MNFSSVNDSLTETGKREQDFRAALVKNLIVSGLCISINYINSILVHTFRKHQILLSNPRYILFIHLVINDMIQLILSSVLFIMIQVVQTSVSVCLIFLMLAITTTYNTPLNLAVMAVECYIAVCMPLRHAQICTVRKTYVLIGLMWAVSGLSVLPDLLILVETKPLQYFYSTVLCFRDIVFSSQLSAEKRNISNAVSLVLVWFTLFFTYFRILFAAKGAAADNKKARNTILLHGFQLLLSMLNYVRPLFEQGLLLLWPNDYPHIAFASFTMVQILPRFVSPIIYGLRDKTFRKCARGYLLCECSSARASQDAATSTTKPTLKLKIFLHFLHRCAASQNTQQKAA
ncbi:odorant receptor 131-2-like [Oryzias melastigma]|nr:odorant receptor 131-2-like [Oryzias melastigma]